jgi:hypothetical protein
MIDDARIEAIVQEVMAELRQGERVRHGPPPEPLDATRPLPPAPPLLTCNWVTCRCRCASR